MGKTEVSHDGFVEQVFTSDIWIKEFPGVARLIGLTIKVEPTGYLAILKALSAEGPQVSFLGKKSILGLARALYDPSGRATLVWRPDKFGFDKKDQVG